MISSVPLICSLLLATQPIETRFAQVAPRPQAHQTLLRSSGQERAVVLLHGLRVQPFSSRRVREANFQAWQHPRGRLVEMLAQHADVYAFAYSQNADLEAICSDSALCEHVSDLQAAGYRQIVLVGHSAGGLIARHFVEDHPDAGVTKVIQVCTPNAGSSWGKLKLGVCECQEPFLDSLTKEGRCAALARREGKRIPEHVEFVCLVGQMKVDFEADLSAFAGDGRDLHVSYSGVCGDGILSVDSQWPADLQDQAVRAHPLCAAHFTVMFSGATAERLAELIVQPQPRWTMDEVGAARRSLASLKTAR